jgi:hypothetical protein
VEAKVDRRWREGVIAIVHLFQYSVTVLIVERTTDACHPEIAYLDYSHQDPLIM